MSADYTVRLEKLFQGPLDLLLHLVREQEVEIEEIEISRILEDYLAYLDKLEALDLEIAGDFLVMAATLMAIKSRSLLPGEEVDLEEELDPRDELIQRLLEYRRFRSASESLADGMEERARQVERGYDERPDPGEREFELGELTVWDLLSTFSRLMRETLADRTHHVQGDPRPLRYYVDHVVQHLRVVGHSSLRSLTRTFEGVATREALIGSFCALLELVRLELIRVLPAEDEDDIRLEVHPDHAADLEQAVDAAVVDDEELRHGGEAGKEPEPATGSSGAEPRAAGAPDVEAGANDAGASDAGTAEAGASDGDGDVVGTTEAGANEPPRGAGPGADVAPAREAATSAVETAEARPAPATGAPDPDPDAPPREARPSGSNGSAPTSDGF